MIGTGARQGIALFGFDVLYASAAPDMPVVVDVNYFPGAPPHMPFRRLLRPRLSSGRVFGAHRLACVAYDGIAEFYPRLMDLVERRAGR